MIKQVLTFENFDGETVTEEHYFHISKPELIEMEAEVQGGFGEYIKAAIKAEDNKTLIEAFKKIVQKGYGVRSEDGKRFIKSEEQTREFTQTAAYEHLFFLLATDEAVAANFVNGALPSDLAKDAKSEAQKAIDAAQASAAGSAAPTT